MRRDCHPLALAVVVANDNLARGPSQCSIVRPSNKPQLNAKKSCLQVQSALELYGVMVIPVINCSRQYLEEILKELRNRDIKKSCELFWFIFTGHGSGNQFCMNGESMLFNDLIKKASRSLQSMKWMVFFFECCQTEGKKIEVVDIKRQYMALYSSPPNKESYHHDGVGLLVTCMAKILEAGYEGSLNSFQQTLRCKYLTKLTDVLGINVKDQDVFKRTYLPIHTNSIFDDLNLYEKTCNASKFISG